MAEPIPDIRITDHAKERSMQRFWIGEDRLREMAQQAVRSGFSIDNAPNDKVRRYLKRKAQDNLIYMLGGYVFIFSPEYVLITTYRLPNWILLTLKRENTYIGK